MSRPCHWLQTIGENLEKFVSEMQSFGEGSVGSRHGAQIRVNTLYSSSISQFSGRASPGRLTRSPILTKELRFGLVQCTEEDKGDKAVIRGGIRQLASVHHPMGNPIQAIRQKHQQPADWPFQQD